MLPCPFRTSRFGARLGEATFRSGDATCLRTWSREPAGRRPSPTTATSSGGPAGRATGKYRSWSGAKSPPD